MAHRRRTRLGWYCPQVTTGAPHGALLGDGCDRYDAVFPFFLEIVPYRRKPPKVRHICHFCHPTSLQRPPSAASIEQELTAVHQPFAQCPLYRPACRAGLDRPAAAVHHRACGCSVGVSVGAAVGQPATIPAQCCCISPRPAHPARHPEKRHDRPPRRPRTGHRDNPRRKR